MAGQEENRPQPTPWRQGKKADLWIYSGERLIAKVCPGSGIDVARLIAAAPELLEALRQMVLLFDDCRAGCLLLARADHAPMTNGDQEIIGKAFIAAESAIRKAKEGK